MESYFNTACYLFLFDHCFRLQILKYSILAQAYLLLKNKKDEQLTVNNHDKDN